MAKKVLINKKTGKEFPTSDPDAVLKKYPKTFRVKPAAKLNEDVVKKDSDIQKKAKKIDVKDDQELKDKKNNTPKEESK